MMNENTIYPAAAIETIVHSKNENGEDVPSYGYFSYAQAMKKQDGTIKSVVSPMMHVNLTSEEIQQQQSQQQVQLERSLLLLV